MSKSNSGGVLNSIGKVLTYIFVVLLVLGIAGMVAYFALRGQGVTYYVEYNGERYVANGDGGSLELLNGETHTFSVKSLTGGEVNYSVKVTSNGREIVGNARLFYDLTNSSGLSDKPVQNSKIISSNSFKC